MTDGKTETIIHVGKKEPSPSSTTSTTSSNFRTAREEPWCSQIEKYMNEVVKLCDEKANQHDEAGYFFKSKKVTWGLPMVIVPAIFSPVSLMMGWNRGDTCDTITASDYINASGFMFTAFFTAVYGFFDYGVKYQTHFNHSYMFGSISSKIKAELVKHRRFRRQADVFMVEINMELDNAVRNEPILPKSILKKETRGPTGVQKQMSQFIATGDLE